MSSKGDDFTFCILTVERYEKTKVLEYDINKFNYDCTVSLKFNSEEPLNGKYTLKEEKHEHTYQYYRDEDGHSWFYTCGCDTPPNLAEHFDGDDDGKCDDCGYVMVIALLQEYADWLLTIKPEDIAEIKTSFAYAGVAPGSFKKISRTKDRSVITNLLDQYANMSMKSVSREETEVTGGRVFKIEFILIDGTMKEFSFNNGFYTYESIQDNVSSYRYFKLDSIPDIEGYENVTLSYGFVTYNNIGKVFNNGGSVGEISLNEFEFIELTDMNFDVSCKETYYIETEFGGLSFFSDAIFYIDFPLTGHTDYYRLIGKTIEDLLQNQA